MKKRDLNWLMKNCCEVRSNRNIGDFPSQRIPGMKEFMPVPGGSFTVQLNNGYSITIESKFSDEPKLVELILFHARQLAELTNNKPEKTTKHGPVYTRP